MNPFSLLQSRVSELQHNCQQQEDRHRELTKELQTLRSAASKNNFKHPSNHSPSHHRDLANHSPSHHRDLANHSPSHPANHSLSHHKESSNQKSLPTSHSFPVEGILNCRIFFSSWKVKCVVILLVWFYINQYMFFFFLQKTFTNQMQGHWQNQVGFLEVKMFKSTPPSLSTQV